MQTTETVNPKDKLLGAAQTKGKGKGAAKCPEAYRPEYEDKCKRWQEIKSELKKQKGLQAELRMIEAELSPIAEQARVEESRRRREPLSSVKLNGILFVSQAKYADVVNDAQAARLKEIPNLAEYLSTEGRISYVPSDVSEEWQQALSLLRKEDQPVAFDLDMSKVSDDMADALLELQRAKPKLVELTRRVVVDPQLHRDATMRSETEAAVKGSGLRNVAFFRS